MFVQNLIRGPGYNIISCYAARRSTVCSSELIFIQFINCYIAPTTPKVGHSLRTGELKLSTAMTEDIIYRLIHVRRLIMNILNQIDVIADVIAMNKKIEDPTGMYNVRGIFFYYYLFIGFRMTS